MKIFRWLKKSGRREVAPDTGPDELIRILRKRLVFYKICVICLIAGICLIHFSLAAYRFLEMGEEEKNARVELPYYDEVMKLIKPLRYTGLTALIRPDIGLELWFEDKQFSLSNLHRYGEQGEILLEEGREGLCGELAAYVYRNLKPILPERYSVSFVRACETSFFANPQSTHVVLMMEDSEVPGKRYLIDPSFHRYGKVEDLDSYMYAGALQPPEFKKSLREDTRFDINGGIPILIRHDFMSYLMVNEVNGRFDSDNFMIVLGIQRCYKYGIHYAYSLVMNNGKPIVLENSALARKVFNKQQYDRLKKQLQSWFSRYAQGGSSHAQ